MLRRKLAHWGSLFNCCWWRAGSLAPLPIGRPSLRQYPPLPPYLQRASKYQQPRADRPNATGKLIPLQFPSCTWHPSARYVDSNKLGHHLHVLTTSFWQRALHALQSLITPRRAWSAEKCRGGKRWVPDWTSCNSWAAKYQTGEIRQSLRTSPGWVWVYLETCSSLVWLGPVVCPPIVHTVG